MLLIERKDYFSDQEFTFVKHTLANVLFMSVIKLSYEVDNISSHSDSKKIENLISRYERYIGDFKLGDGDADDNYEVMKSETEDFMKNYINKPDIKRMIFDHIIELGKDITKITTNDMIGIALGKIPEAWLECLKYNMSAIFKLEYMNLNFNEKQKKLAVYLFVIQALFFELETAKELTLYIANEYNLETEYALEIYDIASKQANLCIQIDKQTEELLEIILE